MKNKFFFVLLGSTLLLSACSKMTAPATPETAMQDTSLTLTEQRSGIVTVALAEQNLSGQSRTATFEDLGGKTKVTLTLTGGEFVEPQPAHIHSGKCPTPGEVRYSLTNVVYGLSETVLDVEMSSLWNGDLALNVHKSSSEASIYTACGDLMAPESETLPTGTESMMDTPLY